MNNTKILGWNILDIKSLFNFINKNPHEAVINNITTWANKKGKKPFSVRNYFYKLKKEVKQNIKVYNLLKLNGVDINCLKDEDKQQLKDLLYKILNYKQKKSVFSVCLELSNNNLKVAKKLNNKYRNTLSNNPNLVEEVIKDLQQNGIPTRLNFASKKVVLMPQTNSKVISNQDVQALVLGVVNLIKNNAKQEVLLQSQKDIKTANNNLQKALIDLRRKNMLLEELKAENLKIKEGLEKLNKQQQELTQQRNSSYLTIKELLNSKKQQALSNFVEKLVSNYIETNKVS